VALARILDEVVDQTVDSVARVHHRLRDEWQLGARERSRRHCLTDPVVVDQWIDRHGQSVAVNAPPGDYRQLDLSPDATRVAIVRFDPRKRSSDVLTIDLQTGLETQVTDDPWPDANPVWAPNGDRLAFGSLREGRWGAFARDPTRAGQEQELPRTCAGVSAWFPDGNSVLCPTLGNTTALLKVPIDQVEAPASLVRGLGYADGRVSPDGSWLAYTSNHDGPRKIYVVALNSSAGSTPLTVTAGDAPRWRADGRELFFLSGRTLMSVSFSASSHPQLGPPQPLFEVPLPPSDSLEDVLASYGVSRDGSKFLFAVAASNESRFAIHVQPHWTASSPLTVLSHWP
jgi:Tol biopolymer transport system component